MTNSEQLYELYKDNPTITNQEVAKTLNWDDKYVRKYKFRLKQRGLIHVTESGVHVQQPFSDSDETPEVQEFKADGYRHLYTVCMDRLENKELSDSQFTALVQEIRLILEKI